MESPEDETEPSQEELIWNVSCYIKDEMELLRQREEEYEAAHDEETKRAIFDQLIHKRYGDLIRETCIATQASEVLVRRVIQEGVDSSSMPLITDGTSAGRVSIKEETDRGEDASPGAPSRRRPRAFDNVSEDALRRLMDSLLAQGRVPTVDSVLEAVKMPGSNIEFFGSRTTLWKELRRMGYQFGKSGLEMFRSNVPSNSEDCSQLEPVVVVSPTVSKGRRRKALDDSCETEIRALVESLQSQGKVLTVDLIWERIRRDDSGIKFTGGRTSLWKELKRLGYSFSNNHRGSSDRVPMSTRMTNDSFSA